MKKVIVLLLCAALLAHCSNSVAAGTDTQVPVFVNTHIPEAKQLAGFFTYTPKLGELLLYCIGDDVNDPTLTCVGLLDTYLISVEVTNQRAGT